MNRQRKMKTLVFVICLILLFGFYKFIAQPKLKLSPLKNNENNSSENNLSEQDAFNNDTSVNYTGQIINSSKTVVKRDDISNPNSGQPPESQQLKSNDHESDSLTFPVHIMGSVKSPGVYQVNAGMIIQDVIELSGGLNSDADLLLINLAEPVQANTKIYIPNKEEIEQDLIRYEMTINSKTNSLNGKSLIEKSDKVNLNTADFELLQTLTGIGPVKAQAILDFREENGAFQMIEDIMAVPGIKEAGFAKIKDQIVVN
ncbi:MAG: hypothetical protein GX328_03815 [Clostridiaceae bacterium]|nr:hypothetical protein [Clostridiaceae bacterium]